jgi:protein TonB
MDASSTGHLSIHGDAARPAEVPFLFDRRPRRLAASLGASLSLDVVLAVLLVIASRHPPNARRVESVPPENPNPHIIWLTLPGPGGGGGGGGNRMNEPPPRAELVGREKLTVPAAKPPTLDPPQQANNEPDPIAQLDIPARTIGDAHDQIPGLVDGPARPPTISRGIGNEGGFGTGPGRGAGPDAGSGLGPGSGGNFGGGPRGVGAGVTPPIPVREVKPQYTSGAMQARVQGNVLLACVVEPDGSVGDVRVVRSLDSALGLDSEAIKAVRQWRFRPGTRTGEPVAVQVTIELTFTLR